MQDGSKQDSAVRILAILMKAIKDDRPRIESVLACVFAAVLSPHFWVILNPLHPK